MDIDVYLQPLTKELLQLWNRIDVFDAYTKTNFKLHGFLHSTTSDFSAYITYLGGVLKVILLIHLVLEVYIQCD